MTAEEKWMQMESAKEYWDRPQYTVSDVCELAQTTSKALEHLVDPKRGLVMLSSTATKPGSGRRRLFSATDALKVKTAFAMTQINFPQRWSKVLTDMIARRALHLDIGLVAHSNMSLVTYPLANDDWAFVTISDETKEEPELPDAVCVLQMDSLIERTKLQFDAIISGVTIPNFAVPAPDAAENVYAPRSNFMNLWDRDSDGQWKYVGLTREETDELMQHEGIAFAGDDLTYFDAPEEHDQERLDYFIKLQNCREEVRMLAIAGTFEDEQPPEF